jgi:hypothetical protein
MEDDDSSDDTAIDDTTERVLRILDRESKRPRSLEEATTFYPSLLLVDDDTDDDEAVVKPPPLAGDSSDDEVSADDGSLEFVLRLYHYERPRKVVINESELPSLFPADDPDEDTRLVIEEEIAMLDALVRQQLDDEAIANDRREIAMHAMSIPPYEEAIDEPLVTADDLRKRGVDLAGHHPFLARLFEYAAINFRAETPFSRAEAMIDVFHLELKPLMEQRLYATPDAFYGSLMFTKKTLEAVFDQHGANRVISLWIYMLLEAYRGLLLVDEWEDFFRQGAADARERSLVSAFSSIRAMQPFDQDVLDTRIFAVEIQGEPALANLLQLLQRHANHPSRLVQGLRAIVHAQHAPPVILQAHDAIGDNPDVTFDEARRAAPNVVAHAIIPIRDRWSTLTDAERTYYARLLTPGIIADEQRRLGDAWADYLRVHRPRSYAAWRAHHPTVARDVTFVEGCRRIVYMSDYLTRALLIHEAVADPFAYDDDNNLADDPLLTSPVPSPVAWRRRLHDVSVAPDAAAAKYPPLHALNMLLQRTADEERYPRQGGWRAADAVRALVTQSDAGVALMATDRWQVLRDVATEEYIRLGRGGGAHSPL